MKYFAAVTDKEGGEAEAEAESKAATPAAKAVPGKAKKAPAKALPELMEEEVIPALRSTLEAQEDVSQVELSFQDNRVSDIHIHVYLLIDYLCLLCNFV